MSVRTERLDFVFEGWDGYNTSLIRAIAPLTAEQLDFRIKDDMRSVGEVAWHISRGRVDWFRRMLAPGSEALWKEIEAADANPPTTAADLVSWLEKTWTMVADTLSQWTVHDLAETYRHGYQGTVYAVSRQWTVWRILTHDVHHGGQLTELLAQQGIEPPELTWLGGHLTVPALAE